MNDPTQTTPRWSVSTMREVAEAGSPGAAAVRYAALGIPVFPCVPAGKRPLTANGFHDATASLRAVSGWWRRHPTANIGLPTGAATGVVVVDVDVHLGGTGFAAFERSRAVGLADGWGWLVRTPSGGLHAYYPAAPGREQRCWQVSAAHVDFRGDGGYVIAPPSRVVVDEVSIAYEVIAVANRPARPLDAGGLRRFLQPTRWLPTRSPAPAIGTSPERLAAWVATRPEGGRNQGLFWAACRMVEGGHPCDSTLAALGDAARSAGLPDHEIETTIRSAYRIA
ncbi:MAG: bifunctional DNA primase/polymerase, partial [Nocardioidaceae bacterium]|nr:bifunctional DNA primase/polymerase [Nocardioidaceae bacterium]